MTLTPFKLGSNKQNFITNSNFLPNTHIGNYCDVVSTDRLKHTTTLFKVPRDGCVVRSEVCYTVITEQGQRTVAVI